METGLIELIMLLLGGFIFVACFVSALISYFEHERRAGNILLLLSFIMPVPFVMLFFCRSSRVYLYWLGYSVFDSDFCWLPVFSIFW